MLLLMLMLLAGLLLLLLMLLLMLMLLAGLLMLLMLLMLLLLNANSSVKTSLQRFRRSIKLHSQPRGKRPMSADVNDVREDEDDLVGILGSLANFIQNQRIMAYNEAIDTMLSHVRNWMREEGLSANGNDLKSLLDEIKTEWIAAKKG